MTVINSEYISTWLIFFVSTRFGFKLALVKICTKHC